MTRHTLLVNLCYNLQRHTKYRTSYGKMYSIKLYMLFKRSWIFFQRRYFKGTALENSELIFILKNRENYETKIKLRLKFRSCH